MTIGCGDSRGPRRHLWAALTFTAIIGAIVVVPLIYFGFVAVRESAALLRTFAEASHDGPPPPAAMGAANARRGRLDPESMAAIDRTGSRRGGQQCGERPSFSGAMDPAAWSADRAPRRHFGLHAAHAVFCLPESGAAQARRALRGAAPVWSDGDSATQWRRRRHPWRPWTASCWSRSPRAPSWPVSMRWPRPRIPILLGTITGIFAMIPFAAPIAFGAVALILGLSGAIGGAIAVLVCGGNSIIRSRSLRATGYHR